MKKLTPNQIWLGIFGIWSLLLTGFFSSNSGRLGGIVGPGALQAIRLQNLLQAKTAQLDKIQDRINELQSEADSIEQNPVIQQREIRRVLGYAAQDEIIFDFTTPGQAI